MKNLITLFIVGLALFMTSCSKDIDTPTEENFTIENYIGIWEAPVNCTGPITEDNTGVIVITITRGDTDGELNIDFGDEVVFVASYEGSELTLEAQVLNAGQGFDEVSMAATGELKDANTLSLDFTSSVDDEGVSKCELEFTK